MSDYHEKRIDDSLQRIAKSLETIARNVKLDVARKTEQPLISKEPVNDNDKDGEQRILSIVRSDKE